MVGEKLGSFRIEGTLGVGAMGVVYRAVHEATGKPAAVKVVNKEIAQRGKTYERFQREAEILKQFRHPNIVRFLALGRYSGTSYIAMEFISGQTLEQMLNDKGPLAWNEVVELGMQMCEALHYAHEHGVVHRDLKPSNLMVTDTGSVKLTDFGIAKDLDKTALTATGRTLGTAAYMAPEQIRGTPEVSHKTDLYALGIVLYQMLTGRPAFEGNSPVVLMHCHMNEKPPRPSAKVAEIPKALDDLVLKLMAKDPADRPWDAAAVGESLKTIHEKAAHGETVAMVWATQDGETATPSRGTETPRKKKPGKGKGHSTFDWSDRSRNIFLLETAGLVLLLLAIGGVIGYILWPPSAPYLMAKAESLMASDDRHDWGTAIKDYVDPLDRRFPDNPYKEKTRGWRDQLVYAEAVGRVRMLQSPINTKLNQPVDAVEERWLELYMNVSAAEKNKDDLAVEKTWRELAQQYQSDSPKERAYKRLALATADAERKEIIQRRTRVAKLLDQARADEAAGRTREAQALRATVIAKDGQYTSVADLLPAPPPAPDTPAPAAAPDPPGSSAQSAP